MFSAVIGTRGVTGTQKLALYSADAHRLCMAKMRAFIRAQWLRLWLEVRAAGDAPRVQQRPLMGVTGGPAAAPTAGPAQAASAARQVR